MSSISRGFTVRGVERRFHLPYAEVLQVPYQFGMPSGWWPLLCPTPGEGGSSSGGPSWAGSCPCTESRLLWGADRWAPPSRRRCSRCWTGPTSSTAPRGALVGSITDDWWIYWCRDSAGSRNVAMAYIDHAVSLVDNFNIQVSGKERSQLEGFRQLYSELGGGSGLPSSSSLKLRSASSKFGGSNRNLAVDKDFHDFDILTAEVTWIFPSRCTLK